MGRHCHNDCQSISIGGNMIRLEDIVLVFNNDMPTPDTAFKLLVAYCKKSGRNMWEEFGYTFSSSTKTIIVLERIEKGLRPVGLCNLQYESNDDSLFLNQGFLVEPVDNPSLLINNIYDKCAKYWCMTPKKMVLHSDLPERLWRRFGFKKSKFVIYEKEMGGKNNG